MRTGLMRTGLMRTDLLRTNSLRGAGSERGSAIVEFSLITVVLLSSLLYALIGLASVASARQAVAAAAKEASRAFVTADSQAQARSFAVAASRATLGDRGIALRTGGVSITCSPRRCLSPGSSVQVRVAASVRLPLIPARLIGHRSITVEATARRSVDRFRAS